MSEITVVARGKAMRGWSSVRIRRSIDQLAAGWELELAQLPDQSPIAAGDAVTIKVDGADYVAGYADGVGRSVDNDSGTRLRVAGRSYCADLVDCSIAGALSWQQQTLAAVVGDICSPYGISVVDASGLDAVGDYAASAGESCFEAIDRFCRRHAVWAIGDGLQSISLQRLDDPARVVSILGFGRIVSATDSVDQSQVYSEYQVLSSQEDYDANQPVIGIAGKAAGSGRFRPLILSAEESLAQGDADKRAQWEMDVRAGRAINIQLQVHGWWDNDGGIWRPSTLLRLAYPQLELDGEYLLSAVDLSYNDDGELATLTLAPKGAFALWPQPPRARDSSSFWPEALE